MIDPKETDRNSKNLRERKIDEALEETFPASDTPAYVGSGGLKDSGGAQGIVRDQRGQEQPADQKRATGGKENAAPKK